MFELLLLLLCSLKKILHVGAPCHIIWRENYGEVNVQGFGYASPETGYENQKKNYSITSPLTKRRCGERSKEKKNGVVFWNLFHCLYIVYASSIREMIRSIQCACFSRIKRAYAFGHCVHGIATVSIRASRVSVERSCTMTIHVADRRLGGVWHATLVGRPIRVS